MMNQEINGRVALVTGGGSGISRAIALGLATAGLDVGIADLVAERGESSAEAIRSLGRKACALAVDVGSASDVERLVREVSRQLGPVDILINGAGIYPRSSVVEMTEAEWDRVLTTNLKSVFLVSRAVLPGMIERRYGRIVSITSGLGASGSPRGAHYAASKGAINAFTRSLAREVGEYGINVNAMAPGITDTPMMRGAASPEYIASAAAANPGGRLGQPEDVVGLALFLVGEGSRHMTGQVVYLRS